ncbi:penicillin-binding protein 2 [Candidatus Parcubacteria bacterium]|jgi:penicillin-binding protein 2|nr:penicillin-binding protein 2 [Candidatus Parcubacteria bacterium]
MKDNPFKIQEGSVRDSSINNFLNDRNSGDYLNVDDVGKSQQLGRFFSNERIRILFLLFSVLLFVLFTRAVYLQMIRGSYYRDVAEGNRIRSDVIKANRGLIYDRFGNLMVKNISYFFLYIVPAAIPEDELAKQKMFNEVSKILELEEGEIEIRIEEGNVEADKVLVYENVSYEAAIRLMILSEEQPSLNVRHEPRRQYLENLGMSHMIGFLGAVTDEDIKDRRYGFNDRIGKTGLEYMYETTLKGRDGIREIEVDALFREKSILSMSDPEDGGELVLTIDSKAQEKLHQIMLDNAARYDLPKMAAVVLDVEDGGVLAMGSLPTFDSNIFTTILNKEDYNKIINDENKPLLNRVIGGAYPMGSIFKTIVASAALEEGVIDRNFTVRSTGGIEVGNSFFPDWRLSGHGLTDIYWALADSVNTFFYSIGGGNNQWLSLGLGADKIVAYAQKFGLGTVTNIDLTGEVDGFLPSKDWKQETFGERWYLGDTYNLSIGQGYMLSTPLQAGVLMSYFANDGTAYQPHFVKETTENQNITVIEPQIALTNIISSDNLNTIRRGLRMAVTDGTAQSLQSVPVKVAGKTGTAQFNRNKTPHSWFAAFAPYDDAKIVVVALVEEGGDRGLAVTIVREFMEWYFSK